VLVGEPRPVSVSRNDPIGCTGKFEVTAASASPRAAPVRPSPRCTPDGSVPSLLYPTLCWCRDLPGRPYVLLELYRHAQSPLAIGRYDTSDVQQAVKLVQARHPKTKPAGTSWQALVDYILAYVGNAG
jgi:hypothetical protein